MLEDTIEELKKEIAEQEKKESGEVETEEAQEVKPEEPVKEEEKKEEEPKKEELDNSGYARLRREAAAAQKKADFETTKRLEAETRLAALENPQTETEEIRRPFDPEIEEVRQSLRMTKAEREFQSLEQKFRSKTPEYDAVSSEYAMAMAQSIRIQNPRLSPADIGERTKESILIKAANYMKEGFDPIEELFHEAKELGFTGKSLKKEEVKEEKAEVVEEEIKPDMKKLAANRAKSTGMAASGGKSEGQLTQLAASELTAQEWMKLPASEKKRLMYG